MKCQLLLIGHYFVQSWSDKSTYLFPFWLSVSLILPTTSCIVYQALHCCSVTNSIVNTELCITAMQRNAIIWEFCAVTFAYVFSGQCPGGGTQLFFGGCVPHGLPKVGSKEQISFKKWGSWEWKFWKIWV